MKQIIVILLIVTTLTCQAADVIVDGVKYTWSSDYNGYIVTGWDEDDPREELHILGEVEGLDVIAIQAGAFIDNTTIVSAVIDEGITRIGQNAFNRCSSMKLVTLPEGLTTIEEEAFAGTPAKIVRINANPGLNIGHRAFADSSIIVAVIPDGVNVAPGAFEGCGPVVIVPSLD